MLKKIAAVGMFAVSLALTCAAATAAFAAFALSFLAGLPALAAEAVAPEADFELASRAYEAPGVTASAASSTKVSA